MDLDHTILYRFFEGNASLEEEKRIRDWLEASPDHKQLFLKERKLYDAILLNRKIKQSKKMSPPRKFYVELLKVAAIIVLVWGGSYWYFQNRIPGPDKLCQTIYVPEGQHISLTLPDGTSVWLNAQTRLQYPVSFDKRKRRVILDGEAYFKVARNEEKPFIVQTSQYNVEVLGTEFNVEAYSGKKDFRTTLMSGQVKIASVHDQSVKLILKPSQMAYLHNGKLDTVYVSDFNAYRWREGLICFKNTSFDNMMSTFEKYYGLTVNIENEAVKKQFYSGKFRQRDGIDHILRVLQQTMNFTYEYNSLNDTITIQ